MAQKLDQDELVSHKELLMANSMIVDALTKLLIDNHTFKFQYILLTIPPTCEFLTI